MGRLRGGWALMLLLGAAGCAGGGNRRPPDLLFPAEAGVDRRSGGAPGEDRRLPDPPPVPTTAPVAATPPAPAPRALGGLFARRASPTRSAAMVVNPTIARYFPGFARPNPAAVPAPAGTLARRDSGPAPSPRRPDPADADGSGPMLPVSLNVELGPAGPDAATTRLVAHEQALPAAPDPPPLAESRPEAEVFLVHEDRRSRDLPPSRPGRKSGAGPARRGREGADPDPVAGAPAGPPELAEARPAPQPAARSRAIRPVAYQSETGGAPAMLPPVLFPSSYYLADPAIREADPAVRATSATAPAIPPPAKRAWRPWAARPGLGRREPGDVAEGG